MLRLWPERLFLGLFPDGGWLHAGKAVHNVQSDNGDLIQQLLAEASSEAGLRPWLDVVVGGDMGRLLALPWQPLLRNYEQQRRYAEACFESEGVGTRDWVIQAGYRDFDAPGIALAVRRNVLVELAAQAAARRLRLRSVLPLGAAAYWRHRPARRDGELLILDEGRSMTALSYSGGKFSTIDVQPVGGERELALKRLIRRCRVAHPDTAQLAFWSASASPLTDEMLADAWPEIRVRSLPHEAWR